ncbi:MAG TPA: methyl-accepting chemotaxis protein [Aliidongia sp.]|nr:methyl-accepting chemotaxis protein [Aliidongia sp.]
MLSNLAIRSKLLTGFGALLLLTIAISVLALTQIGTVNDAAAQIRDNWLPSIDTLGDIKTLTARQRVATGRVVGAAEASRAEATKLYDKQTADLGDALARFEKLGIGGNERALYDAYQSLRGPYEAGIAKAFDLARQGQREAAEHAMNDELVKNFRQVQDALEALSGYERKGAGQASAVAAAAYSRAFWVISAGALVAILLAICAVLWLDKDLAQRLRQLSHAMRRLAEKDYGFALADKARGDEVGDMARAIEIFRTSMQEGDALAAAQAAEAEAKAARANHVDALVQVFDRDASAILQSVASASAGLQDTAQSLTRTAEAGARDATAVASASEQAASNVQTVAAAAEELGASINEISRQVSSSSTIAAKAVEEAGRTNVTVQTLTETAERIGAVVSLISNIASQTNLLALNATIEAARAGEAGKGFAVVASEVKALANQTERATSDIRGQIEAMQAATAEAAGAIATIGQTIEEIDHIITAIAAAVEEQGAATQEIARNVQQAALGTSEVSAGMSGVSEVAAGTGSAAAKVLEAAGALARDAADLRANVSTFLGGLKTA